MSDLRCDSRLHGQIVADGVLEVKCSSRFCGAGKGVIVFHRFSTTTGELLNTLRYRDPQRG